MNKFAFEMNSTVRIANGDEVGKVIGRAEYVNCSPRYLVRYVAGDGRAVESWWDQDALSEA